jgi:hypothetical protein
VQITSSGNCVGTCSVPVAHRRPMASAQVSRVEHFQNVPLHFVCAFVGLVCVGEDAHGIWEIWTSWATDVCACTPGARDPVQMAAQCMCYDTQIRMSLTSLLHVTVPLPSELPRVSIGGRQMLQSDSSWN